MKFVIRDDDLNYFSKPEDIEKWYSDIFAIGIPVGFSVVPFVKSISDTYPRDLVSEDKEYPISKNIELVDYINKNKLIEVMQHGCNHETKNGVFEYLEKNGLEEKTRKGKEELEKTFKRKINVFVAPHDSFSNNALRAIENNNLSIIRGKGCKNILFALSGIIVFFKMVFHKIINIRKSSLPAYPYVLNLGKHEEVFSTRLDDSLENLKNNFLYAYKKNNYFVVTAHLYTYKEEQKNKLLELIKFAKAKKDVNFVYPSDLFFK